MEHIVRILRAPGAKHSVECSAPTQKRIGHRGEDGKRVNEVEMAEGRAADKTYVEAHRTGLLDSWLDRLVRFSGSEMVFFLILASLLTWAFLGIMFGKITQWQVGISDAQAILNLVFDSFLMRQQLSSYNRTLEALGCLKSRTASHKRMLRKLITSMRDIQQADSTADTDRLGPRRPVDKQQLEKPDVGEVPNERGNDNDIAVMETEERNVEVEVNVGGERERDAGGEGAGEQSGFLPNLPAENLFGRICTHVSDVLGHIATVSFFWVGIIIWIGFGTYCNWSSTWLLFINSATSALMVFVLAFLANIREHHGAYSKACLEAIHKVDAALEIRLRTLTGDSLLNPVAIVPAPKVGKVQRVIDYYADLVGALVGIVILILTMIIWVVIGPAMDFNANWWLLIGTYAGLVGMNDGFVLRNVFHKLHCYENTYFEELEYEDSGIHIWLDALPQEQQQGASGVPEERESRYNSLTARISISMGEICSHEVTVIIGFMTILCLVIGASAMRWSLTGQLLCNVPPSIIETFFMMALLTGHNLANRKRRLDLANIHARRLTMLKQLEHAVPSGGRSGVEEMGGEARRVDKRDGDYRQA